MSEGSGFDKITIGMDLGTKEMTIDRETVDNYIKLVQWEARELTDKLGIVPPGMTTSGNAKMELGAFAGARAAIWAKSEREFLKPLKIGNKIFIRGKVVDKYVKRDRNYVVAEFETRDDTGDILCRSRETAIRID